MNFAGKFLFLTLGSILAVGCENSPRPYERSSTDYETGRASVRQPDIKIKNERNFDGIRVAGRDTDLDTDYWDALLAESRAEGRGPTLAFDAFRARYHDLTVYESDAAQPALMEFRRWARSRSIETDFNTYWGQ